MEAREYLTTYHGLEKPDDISQDTGEKSAVRSKTH